MSRKEIEEYFMLDEEKEVYFAKRKKLLPKPLPMRTKQFPEKQIQIENTKLPKKINKVTQTKYTIYTTEVF